MAESFLEARGIGKSFAGVRALDDVSIALARGEIRSLVGENGSGKSTLIKIIAGVIPPDAGEIAVEGRPVPRLHPIDAIRLGIQVIYQDLSLFPNLTVAENIALAEELARGRHWVRWREVGAIARDAIGRLGCAIDPRRRVGELTVAERQLVAIARALRRDSRLIVMDEPTSALTPREVETLFSVIRGLRAQGIAILFVSHKLDEVLAASDTITVLRNGRKVAEGEASALDRDALVRHMIGRTVSGSASRPPGGATQSRVLLRVEGLARRGSFEDVSFDLRRGEILGITGLLGSGRTEVAKALFGLEPADAGSIAIEGTPVRIRCVRDAVRAGIAYVPEDRLAEGLFLEQPVDRNIAAAGLKLLARRGGLIDLRRLRVLAARWMEALAIKAPSPKIPVQALSGGNQQKVVLAKWLATAARILILNGPTVGVDVGAKEEIHARIAELARGGMGVIVISDDRPELDALCGRIIAMQRGRIARENGEAGCEGS
ncbi:MAG: sugar ABC transporter ATP-binding protein [Planctomycetes bacterium]|nr:sugar ABC transporter ATP-binding protein [Planctomycetota bacterium]